MDMFSCFPEAFYAGRYQLSPVQGFAVSLCQPAFWFARCGCRNLGEALRRVAEGNTWKQPPTAFHSSHSSLNRKVFFKIPRSVNRCKHDPHEGWSWNRRCGGGCQAHSHFAQGAIGRIRRLLAFVCGMLWMLHCEQQMDLLSTRDSFSTGDQNGADDGRRWALYLCQGQHSFSGMVS